MPSRREPRRRVQHRNQGHTETRAADSHAGTCPECGKLRYHSRAQAKRAAKRTAPGAPLSAYRCGDYWHNGKLPPIVRAGALTRAELKAQQSAAGGVHPERRQTG